MEIETPLHIQGQSKAVGGKRIFCLALVNQARMEYSEDAERGAIERSTARERHRHGDGYEP